MPGLYLNSYPLSFSGDVELFEMRAIRDRYTQEELRALTGAPVWMGQFDAFVYQPPGPDAPPGRKSTKALRPPDFLSLWAVREGLVAHCRSRGLDVEMRRGGEIQVVGLIESAVEDRFRVEHAVLMRVGQEEYVDADAVLTVRERARWLSADPLSDGEVAARAVGQRAVRAAGDGPRRGVVREVLEDDVVLEVGGERVTVPAAHYVISVNSAIIVGWRGSEVLRKVRVISGHLTNAGKKNRHAVEDRFKLVGDAVRKLGTTVALHGGGEIGIGRVPVAIRLEEAP